MPRRTSKTARIFLTLRTLKTLENRKHSKRPRNFAARKTHQGNKSTKEKNDWLLIVSNCECNQGAPKSILSAAKPVRKSPKLTLKPSKAGTLKRENQRFHDQLWRCSMEGTLQRRKRYQPHWGEHNSEAIDSGSEEGFFWKRFLSEKSIF